MMGGLEGPPKRSIHKGASNGPLSPLRSVAPRRSRDAPRYHSAVFLAAGAGGGELSFEFFQTAREGVAFGADGAELLLAQGVAPLVLGGAGLEISLARVEVFQLELEACDA